MYPFDSAPWTSNWSKMNITDKILFFSFINTVKLAIILVLIIYIIIILIRLERDNKTRIERRFDTLNHKNNRL